MAVTARKKKQQTAVPEAPQAVPQQTAAPTVETEKKVIIVDGTPGSALYEERRKEYDDDRKEIQKLKKVIATSFYDLGLRLKNVKEKELWKSERLLKGFPEFCDHYGIGRRTAYNLILVVSNIDREKAEAWGLTLATVVASCASDDAMMKAISEFIAGGCTVREAQGQARHLKAINGGKAKTPPKVPPKAPPKQPKNPQPVAHQAGDSNGDADVEDNNSKKPQNQTNRTGTVAQPAKAVKVKTVDLADVTEKERREIGWLYCARVELGGIALLLEFNLAKRKAQVEVVSSHE